MCGKGSDRLGFLRSWYLSRLKLRFPRLVPDQFILRLRENGRVLLLTTRYNTDDALVLSGIFADREYDTDLITGPIERVLDLGAHCGFGLAYLAARFPDAAFVCVEPDPRNLLQLQRTIAMNGFRATAVAAAVGVTDGLQYFRTVDASPSTNSLASAATSLCVPVVSIERLLAFVGWPSVDVIKLDAEGIEDELIAGSGPALRKTKYLLFELHRGIDASALEARLDNLGFALHQINRSGEQVYLAVNLCDPRI
jgi:FkbM family methyltransferase